MYDSADSCIPLERNPEALEAETFDLLVIGGGINGLGIAWDAALRGLRVALVEKGDFGQAASAGCFKIVHGGLRYLQHFDIARLRESVAEQRVLRQIAPHLVHPLPFLIPCYGFGMRGREILNIGMILYEVLGGDRNAEVAESHLLPRCRTISREDCLLIAPGLNPEGLRGGVVYYDCLMSNCERLSFAVAVGAIQAGARLCNYAEASSFVVDREGDESPSISRTSIRDLLHGRTYEVSARCVVNAAGPWARAVLDRLGMDSDSRACPGELSGVFSKGIQAVSPCFVRDFAVAVESSFQDKAAVVSRGGRSYFVVPWRGYSLVGTSDSLHLEPPDDYGISRPEIEGFLSDVSSMYQSEQLAPNRALYAFGGLRPIDDKQLMSLDSVDAGQDQSAKVSRRDLVVDHASVGPNEVLPRVSNLVSAVGVKYTTFRAMAERVVDLCLGKLNHSYTSSRTAVTQLPGGGVGDLRRFRVLMKEKAPVSISKETVEHLVSDYGTDVSHLYDIVREREENAKPLDESTEVTRAEIIFAARSEMICHLSDVVMRRTGLGTLGHPGAATLGEAANIVAAELGWDRVKVEEEIRGVESLFEFE